MLQVLASMIDGVLVGSVYGLAAIGLTLIWGVMNVINLTHGAVIALGMFALFLILQNLGISPYAALVPIAVGGFVLGLMIYGGAVRRMIGRSHLMSLLATFSVNMVLIGLGTAVWTTSPYNVPYELPGLTFAEHTFPGTHIAAAVAALIIAGALRLFLRTTRLGKAIRAVASNRAAAELMGIPSGWMLAISFALGIAIAATAGGLIATMFPFTILSGGAYQLKSFVVTVLGGLGNPAGALAGGIILGLIEGGVTPFIQVSWIPLIEFLLFIAILITFPAGLFGARKRQ